MGRKERAWAGGRAPRRALSSCLCLSPISFAISEPPSSPGPSSLKRDSEVQSRIFNVEDAVSCPVLPATRFNACVGSFLRQFQEASTFTRLQLPTASFPKDTLNFRVTGVCSLREDDAVKSWQSVPLLPGVKGLRRSGPLGGLSGSRRTRCGLCPLCLLCA